MVEEKKEKERKKDKEKIKIDYDNIDISDIMKQIKRKIATQQKEPAQEEPPKTEIPSLPEPFQAAPEEVAGAKSKVKNILLILMKPFSPLIKFLVLPVYHELRETILNLHQTNMRLDYVNQRMEQEFVKLSDNINKRLDLVNQATNKRLDLVNKDMSERLDLVSKKTNERLDLINKKTNNRLDLINKKTNERLDIIFENLGQTMEYAKLLHNLSHNIVVELTKLKIEKETLKVKARTIEKDFEFLGRREKALERHVFK